MPSEPSREYRLTCDESGRGLRVDAWLAERLPALSRAGIQRLIRGGNCLVNYSPVRPAHRLKPGEVIILRVPPPEESTVEAEDIPLRVLYQDDDIAVVDKAAGIVVHPGAGHRSGTLVSSLLYHIPGLRGVGGVERPGIVHRLDRGTSGVMVVAKTDQAMAAVQRQFQSRAVKKTYLALVWGHLKKDVGDITLSVGRSRAHGKMTTRSRKPKQAVTRYQVAERFEPWCELVRAFPATGRTHQIRVHFAALGHPLVGDPTYGRSAHGQAPRILRDFGRPALHAWRIELEHPTSGVIVKFEAEIPPDLERLFEDLRQLRA